MGERLFGFVLKFNSHNIIVLHCLIQLVPLNSIRSLFTFIASKNPIVDCNSAEKTRSEIIRLK